MPQEPQPIVDTVVRHFAAGLGRLLDVPAAPMGTDGRIEPGWTGVATLAGAAPGTVSLAVDSADARRLASVLPDPSAASRAPALAPVLDDIWRDALTQTAGAGAAKALTFQVVSVPTAVQPPPESAAVIAVVLGPDLTVRIASWFEAAQQDGDAVIAFAPASARAAAKDSRPIAEELPANLDVILDIELPLTVRFGETEMTLDALTRLGPGATIDLERSPDEPVDVLVNGRLVARGEVVVVSGNYGVRILEVLSAAERARSFA